MIQVRPYHLLLSPSPNSQLKQQHRNILLEGPEVQEYFAAHLGVALYALSKVAE